MSELHGAGRRRHDGPTVRISGGWHLPESHLLPDAVVAFVDGELSAGAHERAAMHVAVCRCCAAEVGAQRQARAAVHDSHTPAVPAGLLASLRSIPNTTELPTAPDNLAVTADGQLVTVQRQESAPGPATPLGSAPLGSSVPLGSNALGAERRGNKRAAQGAGVVMSGLVLSALALVATVDDAREVSGNPAAKVPMTSNGVTPATFLGGGGPAATPASPTVPTTTTPLPSDAPEDVPQLVLPLHGLGGLQR